MARTFSQPDDIETVRIPILGSPGNRGTDESKDQRFVNGYFWEIKNPLTGRASYFFIKRPGLSQRIRPPAGNATGRGCYSWKGDVYSVYGTKIYKNSTDLGVTLTTSTGICGITETRPGAATQYLGVNDGVKLYCIAATTGVVTTVTTNFPTPNTGQLLYADGYWFVFKQSTLGLYNCALDDPTSWDASAFITPQMYNAAGTGIARQGNLMITFSEKSIQAFYNNANTTGSPYSNYESAIQQIGCHGANTIVQDEAKVTWVGSSATGGHTVWTLEGITGLKEIASPRERLLLDADTDHGNMHASLVRLGGKKLYILTLLGLNRTLVYDYDLELWTEFEGTSSGTYWPLISFTEHSHGLIAQHTTNGWIYDVSPTIYQDDSTNFTVLARFGRTDLDTMRRKFVKSYELIGDRQSSTANVSFQYSDDDYVTLSTARTFNMADVHPFLTRGGNFRRRAHQFSYSGNTPLRVESLEMKYRLGTS